MDYLAICLTKIYNATVLLPRWLLYMISGGLASIMIGVLHRDSPKAPRQQTETPKVATSEASAPTSAPPESGGVPIPKGMKRKRVNAKN